MLHQDIKEMEIQAAANMQKYERYSPVLTDSEMSVRAQKIEIMEKAVAETKETLEKVQESSSNNIKVTMANFDEERREITKKLELLNQEMGQKDLIIYQLKQDIEQSVSHKEKKIRELESAISEKDKDSFKYKEIAEALTGRIQSLSDDNLDKENKMSKELALSNQKVTARLTAERVLFEAHQRAEQPARRALEDHRGAAGVAEGRNLARNEGESDPSQRRERPYGTKIRGKEETDKGRKGADNRSWKASMETASQNRRRPSRCFRRS